MYLAKEQALQLQVFLVKTAQSEMVLILVKIVAGMPAALHLIKVSVMLISQMVQVLMSEKSQLMTEHSMLVGQLNPFLGKKETGAKVL